MLRQLPVLVCILASLIFTANASDTGEIVLEQLTKLSTFSDDPKPAVTRLIWTENDMKAREYIKSLMTDVGLTVTQDLLGNIYGTLPGKYPTAPAVATGSHIDAIPLSGMYDGTTGVIGAIHALHLLQKSGYQPHVPIHAIMFTSEEPTRFGLSCLGSRAMAGVLTVEDVAKLHDENGTTVLQAAHTAGCVLDKKTTIQDVLKNARKTNKEIGVFVELHIEQGPELEAEGLNIGIVTAIAAPAQLQVTFQGDGGHAGGQKMKLRNDASLAASELALFVERTALATGVEDTVATVGRWQVAPNAVNSVPRDVVLDIDIRDIDLQRRDSVLQAITDQAASIATKRKVRHTVTVISRDPSALSGDGVLQAIEASVKELGYTYKNMPSRAYHDSLFMAQIAPTAMIFIPCEGGRSHRPDEFASEGDIGRGVEVLAATLKRLAGGGDGSSSNVHNEL